MQAFKIFRAIFVRIIIPTKLAQCVFCAQISVNPFPVEKNGQKHKPVWRPNVRMRSLGGIFVAN